MVGAASLPYQISDLSWGWGTAESSPSKDQWNVSWREDAKHVIILFSDEEGQTYLQPSITESVLVNMINAADELSVYVFTSKQVISGMYGSDDYAALASAGMGGKIYELTMKAIEMYNSLLEILDETACGGKKGN